MFGVNDVYELQQCLCSYKKMVDELEPLCVEELEMKRERQKTISHLIGKCEDEIGRLKYIGTCGVEGWVS